MRAALCGAATVLALAMTACGTEPSRPMAPPPDVLGSATTTRTSTLDIAAIAADAVGEAELTAILEDAGVESAIERWFTAGPAIRRLQVRIVRFEDARGAETYIRWLESHVEDVIGDADAVSDSETLAATSLFLHEADPCCPKETNVALAAWRDGTEVVRVLVAGPGADVVATTEYVDNVRYWLSTVG